MPVGEQRPVPVPEHNGEFALYGVLDVLTGETITAPYPKGRSDYAKAFLGRVLARVEGRILLVWDRARWHTSKAVRELIEAHERLEVLLLPKRAAKDNPIEDLWRVPGGHHCGEPGAEPGGAEGRLPGVLRGDDAGAGAQDGRAQLTFFSDST